jgi:hypothetical protein
LSSAVAHALACEVLVNDKIDSAPTNFRRLKPAPQQQLENWNHELIMRQDRKPISRAPANKKGNGELHG